jgi:arylsulfatase A-like enzyme
MERNKDKPFFVYYPMALTHGPFNPPPNTPEWNTEDRFKSSRNYFGDMVEYMDIIVGRILKKIDDLGLGADTLVIFTGDNGTPVGIQSRIGDRTVDGGKGLTTDAGTHVPLLARWTGVIAEGGTCEDLVDMTDFIPTIAEAGMVTLPSDEIFDGRSFLPQLRGEPSNPRDWIYCYFDPHPGRGKTNYVVQEYVQDKRYKLYYDHRLYDLREDIHEENRILPGEGSPDAEMTRKKLQAVLDAMR